MNPAILAKMMHDLGEKKLKMIKKKKEKKMANWGEGYKQGYLDAAKKILAESEIEKFMEEIGRGEDGGPSLYAMANKCCGAIDAHSPNCRG